MARFRGGILSLVALGCGHGATEGSVDTDTTEDNACNEPADLPADPMSFVGKNHPSGLVHLLDVSRDPDESGLFYSVGSGGFFVFEHTDGDAALLGKDTNQFQLDEVEALGGGIVAVAARSSSGITFFDVENPDQIEVVGLVGLGDVAGVAALGDVLYVVTHVGELHTYDISNAGSPTWLQTDAGLGNPWDLKIVGDRAYIADNSLGVVVVDLTIPEAPVIGEAIPASGAVLDVTIDGDTLYAAVGAAGIEVFSLLDPDSPESLGTFDQGASVVSVNADDGLLWAAEIERLQAFDIADPAEPVSLGFEPTAQWAMKVVSEGDTAWVAAWGDFATASIDSGTAAPHGDTGRTELYFADSTEKTFDLTNRGAADLIVFGLAVDDDRFTVTIDKTTLLPGESATFTVIFADDGEDASTELCIATNDPNDPLKSVLLATGSAGSESIAVGEPAIDFVLEDLDGNSHHLADELGHPVVIAYFATW